MLMQRARTSSQETLLTAAAITLTQHRETVGFAFSRLSSSLRILRRSLQCPTLEIVGSAYPYHRLRKDRNGYGIRAFPS